MSYLDEICPHCGFKKGIHANDPICDHLGYPENCAICREREKKPNVVEEYEKSLEDGHKIRLCIKCESELTYKEFAGTGPFDIFGNRVYYCPNKECEHFGLLTVGVGIKNDPKNNT